MELLGKEHAPFQKRKKNVTRPIKGYNSAAKMSYSIRLYSDLTQHPLYQTVSHASPLSRRLLLYLFISFRLKILTVQELLPYSMTSNGGLFTSIVSFSLGIARCILYVYCVTLIGIHTEACVLLI